MRSGYSSEIVHSLKRMRESHCVDQVFYSIGWEFRVDYTAGINRSNTAVRAVLEQPCSTGGRTGTVRPKHLPAGRTGLSDQFLGPVAQDQPGPVGQICPTSWLSLGSDSLRPSTGRTRLFEHRSSSRVRPVNAGSANLIAPGQKRPQRKKRGFPRTHAGSAAGGEESPWSALRPHTGGVSLPCTGQGCKTSPGRRETAGSALSAPASSLSYRPWISEAW
ncbi:hypothetical protein PCANC_03754 [Puccinia coronata f. sp. avenae]|uniref:Uncharacterized protein n=1 Tax=Puccinia coronata f. sp. avenae TaxID=200324 RepID=A0A2N5VVE3_9BASI|nr:hypothetical protein PCANC_03754 [Puccinia coronata f. sp. avenae]